MKFYRVQYYYLTLNMKMIVIAIFLSSMGFHCVAKESLVQKFDAMAERFKRNFEVIVEGERTKMKAEVDAYNLEKERMKGVTVSNDDLISLNVGGEKVTTKRSTLRQVNGSLLAAMFSRRWDGKLQRDKDGHVFFDFNPKHFGLILNYLRAKKIENLIRRATLPRLALNEVKNFNNLIRYLGLENEFKPSDVFKLHSSTGITIEENDIVAVHGSNSGHRYVLGKNINKEGEVRWQLKLESFQSNNWMYVGVAKGDTVPSDDTSYDWSGSYGWALGKTGQVWANGHNTKTDSQLKNACNQGDTVILTLNCITAKLFLVVPSGRQFHHTLPSSTTWKLHVNLHGSNDKIRIVLP